MSNLSLRDFYWLWAMILLFRIGRITEVRIGIRSIISHCAVGVAESLGGGIYHNAEDGEDRVHQPCQVDRELLLPFNCLFELFADVASTVHDT